MSVLPFCDPMFLRKSTTLRAAKLSRPLVGSSRKTRLGPATTPHAMARRLRSPPDRPRSWIPPDSMPPTCKGGGRSSSTARQVTAWHITQQHANAACDKCHTDPDTLQGLLPGCNHSCAWYQLALCLSCYAAVCVPLLRAAAASTLPPAPLPHQSVSSVCQSHHAEHVLYAFALLVCAGVGGQHQTRVERQGLPRCHGGN